MMKVIDLNGQWAIRSACGKFDLKGEVPGTILYELEKAGHFGDKGAFFSDNNRKSPDLMDRDYIYSKEFYISEDFLKDSERSPLMLEAEGLDTLTEIRINGEPVSRTANMHRSYSFDVSDFLREGPNVIEITFFNSLDYIKKEHARRPLMSEDPEGITTIPGFYTIRKSHCSYGWDWGPQMPDAGIWRPIRLVRYDKGKLKNLRILQHHEEGKVFLSLKGECELYSEGAYFLEGFIESPSGQKISFETEAGSFVEITVDEPELWWPAGMGAQNLYRIEAVLKDGSEILGSVSKKIGLRTLTVERKPDQWGESFHFSANGLPLFARGANYIPEDVYLTRVSRDRTEKLLADCVAANFNCIRVWGGGVYPGDDFYDLCDEMGLILWQDHMFACAIYDMLSDDFTENISAEIRDNLERIRHHASIGLICGNNEMEWFFVDYETFPQTKENEFEYIKQYHMVIPRIHNEVCPELFYWSSSPSSGGYFEEPNSPDKGDCHFWAVWHGNKDFSEYRKHYFRFMSEFGFESLPSIKTIETFTEEEDRNIFSPIMEEHQKRVGGNPKIVAYLSKYFRYPEGLDSLAYVSQLSQSDAIRMGVEHWRRNRGRCMGSIYWQLNDNWPVASWSSIDYYGRWKALHYAVKRSYDNVLLSIEGDEKKASIHLSNEQREPLSGRLHICLFSLEGSLIGESESSCSVDSWSSREVHSTELPGTCDAKNVILSAIFRSDRGEEYEAYHNYAIYKYLNLRKVRISSCVTETADGYIEIVLESSVPQLFVEVLEEKSDGIFSDNYFPLMPGQKKIITYMPEKGQKSDSPAFKIRSLVDSY